jgi:porin
MRSSGRSIGIALAASIVITSAQQSFADEPVAGAERPGRWLTPALVYDGSALADLRGGARTGSTYGGALHLKLMAKGEGLGWPGTSAFVDVLTLHGGRPSRLVGDAQGTSNIEGPSGTQIEEAWVQHNLGGSGASILFGIYDLNSEFYRLAAAGLFLNSSFGVGPEFAQSGVEGPSIFPRTSAGVRMALKPSANTVVRAAILDGVPVVRPDGSRAAFRGGDGVLTVLEGAWLSRGRSADTPPSDARDRIGRYSALAPYDDKLAGGVWHYTARYPDLSDTDSSGNPLMRRGSSGAYLVGERLLSGDDSGAGRRLSAFAQAGLADARTNRFGSYVGAGIVGSGWGPLRETDQLGLSVAHARNGAHYLRGATPPPPRSAETTWELSYQTQVSKAFTLQPDLQYVVHPDTAPSRDAALVLQLRFELAF